MTSRSRFTTLRGQLLFGLASAAALMVLLAILRLALLVYNRDQIDIPLLSLMQAFAVGARFDLRVVVIVCLPVLLALLWQPALNARRWQLAWLTGCASALVLMGVTELDFYREFHQRLNSLVFQYMAEDPRTVLSMLWYGFPVARYLLAWVLVTAFLGWCFVRLDAWAARLTPPATEKPLAFPWRWVALSLCLAASVVAARGTLRQGPPLRWGDAFFSESNFANHLALNGTLTLAQAAEQRWLGSEDNRWHANLPEAEALGEVRNMLLTPQDRLVDSDSAAVRRITTPPVALALPVRNVVVILMESFAGRFVGALGSDAGITPYFDALSREGVLFTHFFSNGTHTHQGMFATMACFPNLPGFEYLMQQPEGTHHFSGLPQLLSARDFDDLYVYNGDFAWDNQSGFFRNQGMTRFIGRHDFVNPVLDDPTWGVSDQDMFGRAADELLAQYGDGRGKPVYALLQTLSNHTPYALPPTLPVEPVTGHGVLDEHLTAMRYADWALGQFFQRIHDTPFFHQTLFILVGDHGFGSREQLSDIDLFRFHVPMLMIAPGAQALFGTHREVVGTQIDIVPTIMGRLGQPFQHQCWGRDLLALDPADPGEGVIKPSGSDPTVALVSGDRLLVKPRGVDSRLFTYTLGKDAAAHRVEGDAQQAAMEKRLSAFLQVATKSLLDNTAGVGVIPQP